MVSLNYFIMAGDGHYRSLYVDYDIVTIDSTLNTEHLIFVMLPQITIIQTSRNIFVTLHDPML